jgi:signal recognition particle subunit SRP54
MFDSLTQSLQKVFNRLRGHGRLSDSDIREAMRDVRLALLEADVNFQVARDFVERVSRACAGEEVLHSITPGQQVIKRVYDEMTALLGGAQRPVDFSGDPASALLIGLHGSGKTTTAAKLAAHWKQQGRSVFLAAADLRRPAAVEQLTVLARQIGVPLVAPQPGESVTALGKRALEEVWRSVGNMVIFDTGGRFQIDRELVAELKELREAVKARNVILVVDAALGQESVHVAESFQRDVGLSGLILTKLDGDARGGAALSIQAVTGCPILYTGTGEHLADLEPFYPDRMASRILGMGDVVSLVEKAQQAVDGAQAAALEKRLLSSAFNLEDFLEQIQQMKKMGPLEKIMELLPAGGIDPARLKGPKGAESAEMLAQFSRRAEAIIRSMTARERRHPGILNGGRRRRIARGSGTEVQDVNELLRQFDRARKMARQFGKLQKRLKWMRG